MISIRIHKRNCDHIDEDHSCTKLGLFRAQLLCSEKIHDGNYINESNTKAFRNKTNLFKL